MAKPAPKVTTGDTSTPWSRTHGTYIAGRAYLDEADLTASEMEAKWGAGRLRLLVPPDLREKFDRQRYLLNRAVWHGDLEEVRREAQRMVVGWLALDRAAVEAGKQPLAPQVWEIALADGSVAAIVPNTEHASAVQADGRKLAIYTLDEIGRMLSQWSDVSAVKMKFPGAVVEQVRRNVSDPLDAVTDTDRGLDDELPF